MNADERESAALAAVEDRIGRFFDEARDRAERHPLHYQDLWLALRSSAAGGKRVRPRLAVTSYLRLGGGDPSPAIELATAIELLHTAFLLHDDVIDGDLERRGVLNLVGAFAHAAASDGHAQTVAQRWGESAAIIAGDLLLAAALRLCTTLDVVSSRRARVLGLVDESIFRAAAGELADVAYAAGIDTPTAAGIREVMANKTAHYSLELPLRAGAILAGAPAVVEDRLGAIGRSLGILFQLVDDLLGVFGRPETMGKSNRGDLREGKQTMLIEFARETDDWNRAEAYFGSAELDEMTAQRLRDALETSGARDRLEAEIRRQRDETRALIAAARLPYGFEEFLAREVDALAERDA